MSLMISGVARITKELELKEFGEVKVCNFSVAKNKAFTKKGEEKQANFYDCTVFGKQAENLVKYKKKGEEIFIAGTYEVEKYINNEGQNRYKHYIKVDRIEFIGGKSEGNSQGFEPVDTDEDIPF
ncbi:MAG: single-stranded DNA-binding protein [Paraclostridium sp.]